MKQTAAAYFFIFLIGTLALPARGQVDSTAADSLPRPVAADTLVTSRPDTLESDSALVLFNVRPWRHHPPLHADTAATDSTLRWQLWPSWLYKTNRDPGVITYRTGTIGRTNAQQVYAQEPQYQQLFWEDIRLNDPVSGSVNWSYIPHHKIRGIYEQDLGTVHRTRFNLRQYYLNKPLTQLNYTESSNDTRSLEFVVSSNISQRTNAEISYWDRRDGGYFNNSDVVGRQIFGRLTHQLDRRQQLQLKLLNNHFENGLSFGYTIPDPERYSFDPFQTSAEEPSGEEQRSSTIIGLDYMRRPADSAATTTAFRAGLYTRSAGREATYSADTTAYKVRTLGATARKWMQFGLLEAEAGLSYEYFINREASGVLPADNWGLVRAEAKAAMQLLSFAELYGHAGYRLRGAHQDHRIGAGSRFTLNDRLSLTAGASVGSRMPSPQQLYWQGVEFRGNESLDNEKIVELHSRLELAPFQGTRVGVRGQLKQMENAILIGEQDSMFANRGNYGSLGAAAYADYESRHFELAASATLQQFGDFLQSRRGPAPLDDAPRLWFKGSAYVKGYLFNRAAYVKAGLAGMVSPRRYRTARYYPSLDFWQSAGGEVVPAFNRLDVDLSARVRSIMILLRYENVLDEVVQRGYFETAGYPMSPRRFIFGIRVLFRN